MALSNQQIDEVKDTIRKSLRNKFANYNPEPAVMPFHTRLLGGDRLALYSFIHSLNTNFGVTIFEPTAAALATGKFSVHQQANAGVHISTHAQAQIQTIVDNLRAGRTSPDKRNETQAIRQVCREGEIREVKPTKVDVFLTDADGAVYLIDIKTAKPNIGGFKEYKRTLLEWVAVYLHDHPDAQIHTLIAIPYNPYHPKEYRRWTIAGMIDFSAELKVAEEFWNFLGGEGAFENLLDCFEQVGVEMRNEIDDYFVRFNTNT